MTSQQTQGEAEALVPTDQPQVFNPSEWDDDEIWETSSAVDEREVLIPGTTRRKQAEWTAFLEAEGLILKPAIIPTMVDARTYRRIEHDVTSKPSRGRSDSVSTQNSQSSETTQSSASLQTISTTTSDSPQAALRRAAWNNVIRKVEPRLYELQVPVPIYIDVIVSVAGWEIY